MVCGEDQIITGIIKAAYAPVDHVATWDIDEAPSMCEEREVPDGGHECVPDLAITQLVFRRLCIGKPYCRLSDENVVEAMAPHVSPSCGGHVMSPRLIAQCRPLNLPLPLRQKVPQGDWFLGIQVETRTRDEDFPIAITSAAHMRAMFYSSRTRLPMTHAPMPPPAPPSLCHFKWYKLVIHEIRGGAKGTTSCALSGVRFHDARGAIMEISSAANPKGSSPAKHGAANLVDLSADTWWVDTTYGGAKSCEVRPHGSYLRRHRMPINFASEDLWMSG